MRLKHEPASEPLQHPSLSRPLARGAVPHCEEWMAQPTRGQQGGWLGFTGGKGLGEGLLVMDAPAKDGREGRPALPPPTLELRNHHLI